VTVLPRVEGDLVNNLSDFGSFRLNCTFFFAPVTRNIFSLDKRVSIERRALA
jgi:hypothetical protein